MGCASSAEFVVDNSKPGSKIEYYSPSTSRINTSGQGTEALRFMVSILELKRETINKFYSVFLKSDVRNENTVKVEDLLVMHEIPEGTITRGIFKMKTLNFKEVIIFHSCCLLLILTLSVCFLHLELLRFNPI